MTEEELKYGSDWIKPKKGVYEEHPSTDFYFPKGITKRSFRM